MTKEGLLKGALRKACNSLGRNNDPVIAVLGIAVFKGIFRPLFTMMDKDEKPERKKYAAFREGLTEAIAFCSYLGTSFIAKAIAKPLCNKAKRPDLLHKAEKSLSFIAVCTSAALIIPSICNVTLKPIMEAAQKLQKHNKNVGNDTQKLNIKEKAVSEKPAEQSFHINPIISDNSKKLLNTLKTTTLVSNSNMKVGG